MKSDEIRPKVLEAMEDIIDDLPHEDYLRHKVRKIGLLTEAEAKMTQDFLMRINKLKEEFINDHRPKSGEKPKKYFCVTQITEQQYTKVIEAQTEEEALEIADREDFCNDENYSGSETMEKTAEECDAEGDPIDS